MGEFESIREIARRLVAEFRAKKTIPTVQESVAAEYFSDLVPEKTTAVAVAEPDFDGMDREWLRQLGIEA